VPRGATIATRVNRDRSDRCLARRACPPGPPAAAALSRAGHVSLRRRGRRCRLAVGGASELGAAHALL